jgi:AcrR family transcriptional regulator
MHLGLVNATPSCHHFGKGAHVGTAAIERKSRPGGRSERVVADVLRGAATELARVGYVALRIEDVAQRAGVAKTTVYRRWPTKADLVEAAIGALHAPGADPPDHGDVEADLFDLARQFLTRAATPEGLGISRVITLEIDHPEVEQIAMRLKEDIRGTWRHVVLRAIGRRQLPGRTEVEMVVDMILGTLVTRFVRQRKPIDLAYVKRVIALVLAGIRAS